MDIKGLAAVVTGGGSGMGATTARALAAAGAKVALLDINVEAAKETAREIGGAAFQVDVADGDSMGEALQRAREAHGVERIAVACAGIAPGARLVGRDGPHKQDVFDRCIAINLTGTFNLLRLSAAAMAEAEPLNDTGERGVVVATASVAAFEGQVGQIAYSASKGAVVGMTLPAARELAKFGIRVMTIAPGLIMTPMIEGMPEQVKDSLKATTLFPQRLGTPDEFAKLVLHIAENPMLNGEVIRLDGAVRLAPR